MKSKVFLCPIFYDSSYGSSEREEGLRGLEERVDFLPEPAGDVTAEHAEGIVASIAGGAYYRESFYEAATDLRLIARWGVGYERVHVDLATKYGVIVTVSPMHIKTVAEYTIAQWLAAMKRLYTLNQMAHGGNFDLVTTYEVEGTTLGLYGCGRIGQEVARRARPLLGESGRLLIYDSRPDIAEIAGQFDGEVVDHPRVLFEESDAVSLHVSGAEEVVNYDLISRMQPHASLINPSRGDLVNDADVHRALEEDKLVYYIVDDPPNGNREIHRGHPRVICTNHNGGTAVQSIIRMDLNTIQQTLDALDGRPPQHILNPDVLDHPRVKGFLTT